jgi:hypothetical protein
MDLRETRWGGMEWIHLAQDRDNWGGSCEHGNEPSDFHKMSGNSSVAEQLATSQEGLSSMELAEQRKLLLDIKLEQLNSLDACPY